MTNESKAEGETWRKCIAKTFFEDGGSIIPPDWWVVFEFAPHKGSPAIAYMPFEWQADRIIEQARRYDTVKKAEGERWEKRYYDGDSEGDGAGWEIWIKGEDDPGGAIAYVASEADADRIIADHQQAQRLEQAEAERDKWALKVLGLEQLVRDMDMQAQKDTDEEGTITGYRFNTGAWHQLLGVLAGAAIPAYIQQGLAANKDQAQRLGQAVEALERIAADPVRPRSTGMRLMEGDDAREIARAALAQLHPPVEQPGGTR